MDSIIAWAHQYPFVLAGGSFAAAHWKWIVRLLFKVKWLRAVVVGNPTEAHTWIASLKDEVDADIDEAVADSAAHTTKPTSA